MKSFLKKIITLFVLCVFTFNTTIPAVDALGPVPVSDGQIRSKEVGFTVLGVTAVGVTYDQVMILIVKKLLEELSDDLVQWINNGFDGGPAFATDPADFFLDVANQVAGPFIEDVGGSALCSPFRNQIMGALQISYNSSLVLRDRYIGSCTISGIVGNFEDFLSGDFSQGGWQGWITMTQNQDSNPYGAMITAQSTLAARIASATGVAREELSWSKGFLSSQECTGTGSEKSCVTTTPGTILEGLLINTLGSEIAQLELADEFDEILGALVGQLMRAVFSGSTGLIATNGNPPRWGAGGFSGVNRGGVYSCSPDKNNITLENGTADIIWSVRGGGAGVISKAYLWSGDAPIAGETAEKVTVTYTTPGFKKAFVTITETIMQSGVTSTVTNPTIECLQEVEVKKYDPITGICFPILATDYNPNLNFEQLRAKILRADFAANRGYTQPIRWIVFPKGGSGVYASFRWSSRDTTKPSDFKPGGPNFNSFIVPGSVPLHSASEVGAYYRADDRTVKVNIFDKELNEVDVEEITCAVLKVY